MKNLKLFFICIYALLVQHTFAQGKIDRKALVQRHTVVLSKIDTLASLSVGNGDFAFTTDITGLQTFPDFYAKGISLGTQSVWGWHRYPNTENYQIEETFKEINSHGRKIPYAVQASNSERAKAANNFLRQNPHRLQLGNLGFELFKKDGSSVKPKDLTNIHQTLNVYTGEITSQFAVEGIPVKVITVAHQQKDLISVKVQSELLKTGQLKYRLRLPYPTNQFTDEGNNWKNADKHQSSLILSTDKSFVFNHQLDDTEYFIKVESSQASNVLQSEAHYFVVSPDTKENTLEFSVLFSEKLPKETIPNFTTTLLSTKTAWRTFWSTGGVVDFAGSTDPRAKELERRIILSQYLTKIQCANNEPPQETGLTYNSWFGKPHLEMHWWHGVHFALWNRTDLLEKSMAWYKKVEPEARIIAERQGFEGVRWQKMTDPDGKEAPSSVGAYLLWQQPHFITFAELAYRKHLDKATLEKYKDLVFKTADFMASYAYFDAEKGRYILGKGVIPAQERFKPEETFNPTYELAYWQWALTTAQTWRERLGLKRNAKYDDVLKKLSPLPVQDGVYLATESAKDSYTNPVFLTDHPSVLCTLGMLPASTMLNMTTMQSTFDKVWKIWHWDDTWGWDFPMVAMTATRLGQPEKAVDALMMDIRTNTYLPNGHNYQDARLRLYLPGNGGLLSAVAMMCAGYDGCKTVNPGIPKNGKWKVRWEGLKKMY
ncbi:hypothetical protein VB264_00120 [Arcicella aquatica]|uniref:Glycosyl hydrolase family 65 n=1 Tax=Arcicella aquatica TaxID=217141 RepID=A0ABU5QGJ1_9BACT|nr:hypothetical protein [Arcicella aquatica]MEA5256167.1 hypothetical protein [Arcicella aquatica]